MRIFKNILFVLLALSLVCFFVGCSNPSGGGSDTSVLDTPDDDNGFDGGNDPDSDSSSKEPGTYEMNMKTDLKITLKGDQEPVEDGFVLANYFKVKGSATYRTKSADDFSYVKAIELKKSGLGYIEFTVTGKANVSFGISSTGGQNETTDIVLCKDTKVIAEDDNRTAVSGTSETKFSYSNLEAGTYKFTSNCDSRGVRVMSVKAVQTAE